MAVYNSLLQTCSSPIDQARLKTLTTPHVGDWFHAPPPMSIGLRLSDEAIRVATAIALAQPCANHTPASAGQWLMPEGFMGFRVVAPLHVHHSQLNDVIWRAVKKTQTPVNKQPVGLLRADRKRPDGATVVSWTRGKPLAWDVTVPDTYAASRIPSTSVSACAATDKSAANKTTNYSTITSTRSHRCWDKRRLVLRVGGIHWGSRQANHRHHWRAAENNVSLSEDISENIERQCSRFSQHFHWVIIFTQSGPALLLHPFN